MEIKIEQLKKHFGEKTAVDIPLFTVNEGDILGLVGNNGAGKTTLFRLILDLLQADEGHVVFDGHMNPAQTEDWKQSTGAYIDEGFLIDFLTAEEYFEFIGKTNGMDKGRVEQELERYATFMAGEILGQNKYIRNFSAGNKQKIGIVSALLHRPRLVILDEPFNFLDPTSQNVLKKSLQDYRADTQATILISSHNLQHTVEVCSRIALLENGHIVQDLPNHEGSAEQALEEYFKI